MLETPAQVADVLAEDSVTRVTRRPSGAEAPLLLTSHFGKFCLRLMLGDNRSVIRSHMAFAIRPCIPNEQDATLFATRDFWSRRVTFAIDMLTGRPHSLHWGIDSADRLVTFVKPGIKRSALGSDTQARLIPVNKATYAKCMAAGDTVLSDRNQKTDL